MVLMFSRPSEKVLNCFLYGQPKRHLVTYGDIFFISAKSYRGIEELNEWLKS